MNEEQEKAQSAYNAAMKKLKGGMDARNGAPGVEVAQAMAYQELVRLGVEPQIKRKYRRGKALKQVR